MMRVLPIGAAVAAGAILLSAGIPVAKSAINGSDPATAMVHASAATIARPRTWDTHSPE